MAYDPTTDGGKTVLASSLSSALQQFKGKLSKVALTNAYDDLDGKLTYDDATVKANDKELYVPVATSGTLGVVRAGTGISIDAEGTISADIPVADEHKIGSKDGIAPFFITEDATTGSTVITGNSIVAGTNTTIAQTGDYTYAVNVGTGSKTQKGVLQVGDGLAVADGVVSADGLSDAAASDLVDQIFNS